MPLTETSIKRPIATTMVYMIVVVLGITGFRFLPVDLLPPIEFPRLTVAIDYDNVGPEEMETIITERVENALAGVANVEEITSQSEEGESRVTLNFAQGINLDEASNDVRAALDRIRDDLPEEADPPRLWKFDPNDFPVVIIGARSTLDLDELTLILEEDISKRFEQIPGVGTIDVWGGVNREIRVNLQRDRLMASGLTATDVQNALASENNNSPGGNVRQGLTDLYVRSLGEFTSVNQVAETVITQVEGRPIRVRDVAVVEDGFEDIGRVVRINDLPMIRMAIRKQTGANTVAVSEQVREEINRINGENNNVELLVVSDQSDFIQNSIDNVQQSAVWGALFAIVILYLFLRNGSTTFIISLAIPVSIIATFALLYFSGLTLNQMSFGGLALGVGLIVDNAIVVLENIVRIRGKGKSLAESALVGTKEVGGAVVASTLTTSVIFLPVVFMQTLTGTMFQQLALVVVFALMCSLLVALTLVPMLASKFMTVKPDSEIPEQNKGRIRRFLEHIENRYSNFLEKAIANKYAVFGITLILIAASILGVRALSTELAPQTEADEISIDFDLADGMNIAIADLYVDELVEKVKAVAPMDQVEYMTTEIRGGEAEVELKLVSADKRTMNTYDLADQIRQDLEGSIPGGMFNIRAQSGLWILRRIFGSGGDEAVQLQLRGYDLEQAADIAEDMRLRMERIPEIRGIRSDREDAQPEQSIVFNRERIAELGLSTREVAQAIQANVGGVLAGQYRERGDEFPIRVRLQEQDRLSTLDLDNISVRTPEGITIPVSSLIEKQMARGPESIRKINGQRVTYITADLEGGVSLGEAVEKIQAVLSDYQLPAGFTLVFGGEYEEQQEAQTDFMVSIIMAIILIYMVMAAQFERFLDPVIVMCSVPLSIVGVVPMMLLTGTTINMQSIMGFIMLIGIVVNNAIVLVDYINLMRREKNMSVYDAVVESGRLRLRPILMTTLTTVLGLLPLSFGFGAGGEIQAALARVVVGGLIASTMITLVLIPVVYITADKIKVYVQEKKDQFTGSGEVVAPAQSTS